MRDVVFAQADCDASGFSIGGIWDRLRDRERRSSVSKVRRVLVRASGRTCKLSGWPKFFIKADPGHFI